MSEKTEQETTAQERLEELVQANRELVELTQKLVDQNTATSSGSFSILGLLCAVGAGYWIWLIADQAVEMENGWARRIDRSENVYQAIQVNTEITAQMIALVGCLSIGIAVLILPLLFKR